MTIGLKQSYYSINEGDGPVDVCISYLSGVFNGDTFTVDYSTTSGTAEGKYITAF